MYDNDTDMKGKGKVSSSLRSLFPTYFPSKYCSSDIYDVNVNVEDGVEVDIDDDNDDKDFHFKVSSSVCATTLSTYPTFYLLSPQ